MKRPSAITSLSPFRKDLIEVKVPAGITLKELLRDVPEQYYDYISLELNGKYQPKEVWDNVILVENDRVNIYVRPFGGGGGEKNRAIAQFAVAVAAIAAYTLTVSTLSPVGAAILAAGIQVAGGLLINELFPIKGLEIDTPDEIGGTSVKSLSASKNSPKPYALLPKLYGTRRIVPPYAVNPKVQVIGDEQYLHLTYFLNYGPIQFNGYKIGVDTFGNPISGGYKYLAYEKNYRGLRWTGHNSGMHVDLDIFSAIAPDNKGVISIGDTNIGNLEPEVVAIGDAKSITTQFVKTDTELIQPNIRLIKDIVKVLDSGIPRVYESRRTVDVDLTNYQGNIAHIKFYPDNNHNPPPYFEVWYKTADNATWRRFDPNKYKNENPNLVVDRTKTYCLRYDDEGRRCINKYSKYLGTYFKGPDNHSTYILKLKLLDANGNLDTSTTITGLRFVVPKFNGDGGFTIKSIFMFDMRDTVSPVHTTSSDTIRAEVHLYSDSGIYSITDSGKKVTAKYYFDIYYRKVGDTNWTYHSQIEMSGNSRNPVRKVATINFGSPNSYEIKIKFTGSEGLTGNDYENITWAFLQSFQNTSSTQLWGGDYTDPKIDSYPVLAYIKLKASQNLNGVIDNVSFYLSGLANNVIKGTGWEISNNPALAFVDALCGPQIIKPLDYNTNLDTVEIEEWYDWCETHGFKINALYDKNETLWQRLQKIANDGLAAPIIANNKFTIKRDKEGQPVTQVITPRNSWGFKATKSFAKIPHAAKMKFTNPTTWEEDYIIVYNYREDSSDPNNPTYYDKYTATDFIEFSNYDIIDEEQAKKYARYMLADMMLRPEQYVVEMDVENIIVEPGDKVILAYDTIKVGQTFGRIKDKILNNGLVEAVVVDEPVEIGAGKSIIIRRVDTTYNIITTATYTVDETRSDSYTIYFSSPVADDFDIGALYIYGDTTTISLECKVRKINYNNDLTASLELVNAADNTEYGNIHDAYLHNTIPYYKPIISTTPNIQKSIPPAPEIIETEEVLYQLETGEVVPALRIAFNLQDSPISLQSIVGELLSDNILLSNSVQYEAGIKELYIYPIRENTNYTGRLYTVSQQKILSNITTFSHTTSTFNFIPDTPTNIKFKKETSSSIIISWDPVNYYYPVTYRIYRYDQEGDLKTIYSSDINSLTIPDYFTSDNFMFQTIVDLETYYIESSLSPLYKCPYENLLDPEFDTHVSYDNLTGHMIVTLPIGVTYYKAEIFPNYYENPTYSEIVYPSEGKKVIDFVNYYVSSKTITTRVLLYNSNNQVIYDKKFNSTIPNASIISGEYTLQENGVLINLQTITPINQGVINIINENNETIYSGSFNNNEFFIEYDVINYFSNYSTMYFEFYYTDIFNDNSDIFNDSYTFSVENVSNVNYSIERVGIVLSWTDVTDFLTSKYKIYVNNILWKTTSSTSEIYPISAPGTYIFKIITVGKNKLESSGVQVSVTINKPNIPSNISFNKGAYSTIKLSWDPVSYILPVKYKVYRISNNRTEIIETKDTYYDLQDYFSADSFKIVAYAELSNGILESDESSIYVCPFSEPALEVQEVTYGIDGITLTIKNNTDITYKAYEVREGIYWESASVVGVYSTNVIKLPTSYNQAGTYALLIAGVTTKGEYGSVFDYDLTVEPLLINDILLEYTKDGISLSLDYSGSFLLSEVIWKYGAYNDTFDSSSYLGTSATKSFLDNIVKDRNEFYYFVKATDIVGRESNIFKKYVKINVPNQPTNISIEVDQATQKVILKWDAPVIEEGNLPIDKYKITYLGNIYYSTETEFVLPTLQNNTVIKLQSVDIYGNQSSTVEYPISIDIPNDVTGFSIHQNGDFLLFEWDKVTNTLIKGYEIRRDSWNLGTLVGRYFDNNAIVPVTASGEVTYYIKALSITDEYSKNPTNYTIKVFPTIFTNEYLKYIGTLNSWNGVKYNSYVSLDNTLKVEDLTKKYVSYVLPEFTYNDIVRSKNYYSIKAQANDLASYTWESATFTWESANFAFQTSVDIPLFFKVQMSSEYDTKNSLIVDEYPLTSDLSSKWSENIAVVNDPTKYTFDNAVFFKGVKLTGNTKITFSISENYLSMFVRIILINTILGYIDDGVEKVIIDLLEEGVQIRASNKITILPINLEAGDHILFGIYKNSSDYTIVVKNIYKETSVSIKESLPITNLNNFIFGGI